MRIRWLLAILSPAMADKPPAMGPPRIRRIGSEHHSGRTREEDPGKENTVEKPIVYLIICHVLTDA